MPLSLVSCFVTNQNKLIPSGDKPSGAGLDVLMCIYKCIPKKVANQLHDLKPLQKLLYSQLLLAELESARSALTIRYNFINPP